MRRILLPVVLIATAVAVTSTAGCSSDSSDGAGSDRALAARPRQGAVPDPRQLDEFTAVFRAHHPALAKDRPEAEIRKAAAEICMAQNSGPISLKQLTEIFTNGDVVPNKTTVTEIMKLAETIACAPGGGPSAIPSAEKQQEPTEPAQNDE